MRISIACLISCLVLGCGMSVHTQHVKNGVVVSETKAGVGYRAADIKTVTNTQLMTNCVAGVGSLPDEEEVPLCREEVIRNKQREQVIRDQQVYSPYLRY